MPAQPQHGLPLPAKLFLIRLVLPWIIPLGCLNLSVYGIVLLVALVPCSVRWVRGKAGRIRLPDTGLLLFNCWAAVSLEVVHGIGPAIQPGGMLFIERMGSFLMARCFIRTPDDFRNMVMFVAKLLIYLLPLEANRDLFPAIWSANLANNTAARDAKDCHVEASTT